MPIPKEQQSNKKFKSRQTESPFSRLQVPVQVPVKGARHFDFLHHQRAFWLIHYADARQEVSLLKIHNLYITLVLRMPWHVSTRRHAVSVYTDSTQICCTQIFDWILPMAVREFFVISSSLIALMILREFTNANDIAEAINESQALTPITFQTQGTWSIIESPNFRCRCQLSETDGRNLAACCETWRARLQKSWVSQAKEACWQPKCEVCIHPNREAYNRILSQPGDTSVGSTTINFDEGRPVLRRIDVRCDASDWSNAALPHELTHVTLADRFGSRPLPRWADEGIAMLSESPEKHRERLARLQEILARRSHYRVFDLIKMERLPSAERRDAFYGQSVALVSLLIHKSSPAKFAEFLAKADAIGLEQALREYYEIDGISGLQAEWDRWTQKSETIEFFSLQLQSGKKASLAALGGL